MEKDKKPSVKSAAVVSMAVVLFTLQFSTMETRSDTVEVMFLFCVLFMAGCAISEWVKYLRLYVDFAIEQKLSGHSKKGKD
jgi:hypothetical protein